MAIGPSILEQEDALKNLPTEALQNMMRQPSPNAPPFLVAAELKRREQMAKEFAGKQAEAKTAASAPTVAQRLSGVEQPMPMSQAGAMAAPPPGPAMPQESQIAMALSGATGQPPPQLPTVNAATGMSGPAVQALVKALQKEGTRSYAQRRQHQPFSSEKAVPAPNDGGLAALIAAILKQKIEPELAYGGFDVSEEVKLQRGRGGARAAARPVTVANGTQGRTVYAQTGYHPISGHRLPAGAEVLDGQPQTNVNGSGILTPNALNQTGSPTVDNRSWGDSFLRQIEASKLPDSPTPDDRSAAKVWWDNRQAKNRARAAENQALRQRTSFLDRFRSDIGRPGSVVGWFTNTPADREKGRIFQAKFEELRPQLEANADSFSRFQENPRAFIDAALAGEQQAVLYRGLDSPRIGEPPPEATSIEAAVVEKSVPATRNEEVKVSVAEYPPEFTGDSTSPTGGAARDQFGQTTAALRGRLTAQKDQKADDITGQATGFFKTLNEANKKIYSDLETGLKKFEQADAKDFEKFESRFKALDDFYETGKLPERMRKDRITNLMLEMSKGLLGSQDLYSGFKAGLEGFQAVDKASRDEYAKGLAARLTASKGIMDSKMAMRNSRRQEAIAMTRFAAEQNRGNATLAMEQLKIAQQAKQNERTHQINLIRGEATILSADASMAAAMKGTKEERLLKSLPRDMYAAALAKAKDGDRTELDTYYRRDSQGNVHANMPAFIALINKMRSGAGGAFTAATFGMRVGATQQAIISDARKDAKALVKGGYSDPGWAEVAAWGKKMGVHNGDLPSVDNWKPGAKEKNKAWWRKLAENYYRSVDQRAGTVPGSSQGQRNGAAQGEKRDPAGVRSGITGN